MTSTPIVLVHGIRLSSACWVQVREHLPGREVIAVDLPGHGSRRGERFTIDGAVEVVSTAIDSAGRPAVLVGHSMGGYAAIATAARDPQLVAQLVGAGCTLVPGALLRGAFSTASTLLSRLPDRGEQVSARVLRRTLPRQVADEVIEAGVATEAVPDVMSAAARFDPLAELAAYPGPVRLINGAHDHFRLQERRFLRACQQGSLRVVPGAGHYLPLTHPARFAALLGE
ncbi:alpha/beta fold hydrolase [Epidermidibacterium keratini]|uniref:Alpha/beta fold hydrolase n=1 Tax=Epidermidibacterium keratini TaxID=1891644 RepID=A0A7L4YIU2_9ACTN|nr:alpha/beta hydrolase [Epidermidibacterium keratini]QHB99057.1 alpha/beta fold hydrolase [Epidermidibacterium keratini]